MEAVIYTVEKDGTAYGKLKAINTMAHNKWFNYPIDTQMKNGHSNHQLSAIQKIISYPGFGVPEGQHYPIYIQSEGHGIFADRIDTLDDWNVLLSLDPSIDGDAYINKWETLTHEGKPSFPNGTGIVYYNDENNQAGEASSIPAEVKINPNDLSNLIITSADILSVKRWRLRFKSPIQVRP